MFELLKNYRQGEAKGKRREAGFTLMELLIVIAIVVVLVAIAIPVFTAQLDRAKDAADQANGRALYAIVMADYMDDDDHAMQYDYDTESQKPDVIVSSSQADYPTQTIEFSDRTDHVEVNFSTDAEVTTPPTVTVVSKGNDGRGWIFGDAYGNN